MGQSAVLMRAHFQANDANHNARQAGNAHRAGGFAQQDNTRHGCADRAYSLMGPSPDVKRLQVVP